MSIDRVDNIPLFNKFENAMWEVDKPEELKEVRVSRGLYNILKKRSGHFRSSGYPAFKSRLVWNYGHVDIPIVEDDNISGWLVIRNRKEKKELGNMAVRALTNIEINGVKFEDVRGHLLIEEQKPDMKHDGMYPYDTGLIQPKEHRLSLMPDTSKDISLIMCGLVTAIKGYNPEGAVPTLYITISGVDVDKPWVTYTGKYFMYEYNLKSSEYGDRRVLNRVEEVSFVNQGKVTATIDKEKKPKIASLLSEEEASLVIISLMKNRGNFDSAKQKTIGNLINHLQESLAGTGNKGDKQ